MIAFEYSHSARRKKLDEEEAESMAEMIQQQV